MKRIIFSVLLAWVLLIPGGSQSWAGSQPSIEVFFSPQGGCTEAVVNTLNRATNNVLVKIVFDFRRKRCALDADGLGRKNF